MDNTIKGSMIARS